MLLSGSGFRKYTFRLLTYPVRVEHIVQNTLRRFTHWPLRCNINPAIPSKLGFPSKIGFKGSHTLTGRRCFHHQAT